MIFGALSIQPKIQNFGNEKERYGNFLGMFSENSKTVEIPKCEPFNGKLWKLCEQNRVVLKFPGRNF